MKLSLFYCSIFLTFFSYTLKGQCDQYDLQIEFCSDELSLDLTQYEGYGSGIFNYFENGNLINDPTNYIPDSTIVLGGVYTEDNCVDSFNIILDVVTIPEPNFLDSYVIDCNNPSIVLNVGFSNDLLLDSLWIDPSGTIFDADQMAVLSDTGIYTLTIQHLVFSCFANTPIEVVNGFTIPTPQPIELIQNCDSTASLIVVQENDNTIINWIGPGILGDPNEFEILISAPGEYFYSLTDVVSGCTHSTAAFQVDSIGCMDSGVGINDKYSPIVVFPNPITDFVQIEGADEVQGIIILDQLGRKILEHNSTAQQYDINQLIQGHYFLGVKTDSGIYWQPIQKE